MCNPNNIPLRDKFEEWEEKQGLKDDPEATRMLIDNMYSPRQQQPQQPRDPYLEQVRKEHEENQKLGEEETSRINRLPKRKVDEWLESEEQD